MENVLIDHLSRLISAYSAETGRSRTTVAKAAAGDWRFFDRLGSGSSFTIRTYDRVVSWFSGHWPVGLEWPSDIPRPSQVSDHEGIAA